MAWGSFEVSNWGAKPAKRDVVCIVNKEAMRRQPKEAEEVERIKNKKRDAQVKVCKG